MKKIEGNKTQMPAASPERPIIKTDRRKDVDIRTLVDVKNEREGGILDAMVPIELIDRTEVPVDQAHVDDLVRSMKREMQNGTVSGMLTPILLAQIPGNPLLSIVDGFHRDAAAHEMGSPMIYGSIRPNTTLDELLDLRIMTARSHKEVSFSRTYEWVTEAWERTEWAKQGLSATQAFGMANNKKLSGRNLGLSPEEVAAIRQWAYDKCVMWESSAQNIYTTLVTASFSDPELVKSARGRKSGHQLTNLTPQHLGIIARAFPQRFREQNLIAGIVLDRQLTIENTNAVIDVVRDIEATETVEAVLEQTDWDTIIVDKKKGRPTTEASKDKNKADKAYSSNQADNKLRKQLLVSEVRFARLALDNSALRGNYLSPSLIEPLQGAFTIQFGPSNEIADLVQPVNNEATIDRFLEVAESAQSLFVANLMKQKDLTEEQAEHALREAGNRISRDIRSGALRFVDFSNPRMFTDLIKMCALDEAAKLKRNLTSGLSEVHEKSEYTMESALTVLPTLGPEGKSTLALVGLLNLGSQSVAQALRTSTSQARDYIGVVDLRLEAEDRKREPIKVVAGATTYS